MGGYTEAAVDFLGLGGSRALRLSPAMSPGQNQLGDLCLVG